jgi:hypothetical protein
MEIVHSIEVMNVEVEKACFLFEKREYAGSGVEQQLTARHN